VKHAQKIIMKSDDSDDNGKPFVVDPDRQKNGNVFGGR
jgi:hypothetical protein